jgi:lysozyme family protein
MADFRAALALLLQHEGGWVDDPTDRGGESFRGIARRRHPDWSGWRRIDAARRKPGFPAALERDRYLPRMVAKFYKDHYWDVFRGDALASDALARELLEAGVHIGHRRAVRFLQQSLNLLNRNGRDYAELVVDGLLGERSRQALAHYLQINGSVAPLLKLMNLLQGSHYVAIMRADPTQERFARGWLQRT